MAVSFILAGPVFLEEYYGMLLSSIITAIVGNMSARQLAAFTLGTLVQSSIVTIFGVTGVGAAALAAREAGSGNGRLRQQIIDQTMGMGIVSGILLSLAGFFLSGGLHLVADIEPETVLLAEQIFKILSLFIPFQLLMSIGKVILRGIGETRPAFLIGAISNTIILAVTSLLVFGVNPGLDVYGAVWGSGSGSLVGALLTFRMLRKHAKVGLELRGITAFSLEIVKRIVRISFPVAGEKIALQIGFTLYSFELLTVGTKQFAANQIAQQIEAVSLTIGVGLAAAVMAIVGQSLGRQQPSLARNFTRFINGIAVVAMTIAGTIGYLFADLLGGLFVTDKEVVGWTGACLLFALLEQPTLATGQILGNALRGASDTRWPAYSTIAGMWLVRVPLTYLLIDQMGMNVSIAWLITAADHLVRCVILALRFTSDGWVGA